MAAVVKARASQAKGGGGKETLASIKSSRSNEPVATIWDRHNTDALDELRAVSVVHHVPEPSRAAHVRVVEDDDVTESRSASLVLWIDVTLYCTS